MDSEHVRRAALFRFNDFAEVEKLIYQAYMKKRKSGKNQPKAREGRKEESKKARGGVKVRVKPQEENKGEASAMSSGPGSSNFNVFRLRNVEYDERKPKVQRKPQRKE